MAIIDDICRALDDAGLDARLPGGYDGLCKAPYLLVSDGGRIATGKTVGRKIFYVTVYVPLTQFSRLRPLLASVQSALSALAAIRTTGDISPVEVDDENKSFSASIEYSALCAL